MIYDGFLYYEGYKALKAAFMKLWEHGLIIMSILVLKTSVLFLNLKEWYYTTKSAYALYTALQTTQIAAAASTVCRIITVMWKDELSEMW